MASCVLKPASRHVEQSSADEPSSADLAKVRQMGQKSSADGGKVRQMGQKSADMTFGRWSYKFGRWSTFRSRLDAAKSSADYV